jgi:hypothetical protein
MYITVTDNQVFVCGSRDHSFERADLGVRTVRRARKNDGDGDIRMALLNAAHYLERRISGIAGPEDDLVNGIVLLEKAGEVLFKAWLQTAQRLEKRDRRQITYRYGILTLPLTPAKANRRDDDQEQESRTTYKPRQCRQQQRIHHLRLSPN